MLSRREVLKACVATAGATVLPRVSVFGGVAAAAPSKTSLSRFSVPLPIPAKAAPVGANLFHLTQRQALQTIHPKLGATAVWGYDDGVHGPSSPGPTIEVRRGTPTTVSFENRLPGSHLLPVDTSLTGAYGAAVRSLTHLHGAFVAGAGDGNPYATPDDYTPGETQTSTYPNEQATTTLWYHDHANGITRLNVYAGLSGFYLIRDGDDTGLEPNPAGLPGGAYEIPLSIQDRSFGANGQLSYPGPGWVPEFFGDTVLVNGAAWPFLAVEPRLYRFRILNGSNSRFYNLGLADGPGFWHIGADGGLFDAPVFRRQLLLLPAERADVVVDFSGSAGKNIVVRDLSLPAGVSTPGGNLAGIMQFRVGTTVTSPGPATVPASLPGSLPGFGSPARTRVVTLEEALDAAGNPIRSLLEGKRFDELPDVLVPAGSVEEWLLVNLTEDSHPIHLHLVQFQVVDRRPMNVDAYAAALAAARSGGAADPDPLPYVSGGPLPAQTDDRGFKDTVAVNPGGLTRIRASFTLPTGITPPQRYVFHCHILEHEDNDMMRPYEVV